MARMRPHVESCANFNRYQSAYRRGHSTETTLSAYVAHRTSGSTPTSTNAVSTSEWVIAYRHQSAATTEFLKAVCSVPCCSLSTPRQLSASSHPSETFTMLSTPMTLNYTSLSYPLTRHSALSMTVSSPSIVGWTSAGFVRIQTKPKRSSLVPLPDKGRNHKSTTSQSPASLFLLQEQ